MDPAGDISIVFLDGETMHFPAVPGASILESAEKAGNTLASNCREGTCRTCLSRDDRGEEVLLCSTPARPALRLNVPYRRADLSPPTLRRAKINAVSRLSRSVWEVRYRLQFPLPFLPGQYVEAHFPGTDGPRRFSMANPPSEKEQVLHVRDLPGGAVPTYLAERAKPEDPFTVRGPFGVFYLRSTRKPKLLVAGGTGLAPILSMLAAIDAGDTTPLAVVAGFASSADAYALDRLSDLARRLPLEVVLTADHPDGSWPGRRGNPIEAVSAVTSVPIGPGTEAYLCGPPGMVKSARTLLIGAGLREENVLNEEFAHGP
jgi:NAD(P)H-flavin reductase